MMFGKRAICDRCERSATIEMQNHHYCSEHALEKLKRTEKIPMMRLVQR